MCYILAVFTFSFCQALSLRCLCSLCVNTITDFFFNFNPYQDPIDQKEARGRKKIVKDVCVSLFFCTSSFEKPCVVAVTISYHLIFSCNLFSTFKSWFRLAWGWGRHPSAPQRRPSCLWLAIRNVCSLHCPTVPIMIRRSNITEAHTMYYYSLAP